MENHQKLTISEIKKKLNNKKAIVDFFREQGKLKTYLTGNRILFPKFLVL